MAGMLREFGDFLLRGNLVELAVAVVIGSAFRHARLDVHLALFTP